MAEVVVFGTGQWAKLAHFYLTHDSLHELAAFTVDGDHIEEKELLTLPVVPFEEVEELYPPEQFEMFIPVGLKRMNHLRADRYHQAKKKGYELVSYVSSKATTWPGFGCGDNCFILEDVVIQPFVEIGNDVVIWSGSHVGHHSVVGDHVMLAPNAVVPGNCTVETYSFVGANATVRDEVVVANDTLVGAGVTILKDTREYEFYGAAATEPARVRTDQIRNLIGDSRQGSVAIGRSTRPHKKDGGEDLRR